MTDQAEKLSDQEIGKRLRLAREGAKFTQQEAAEAVKIARTTLAVVELGQRRARLDELQKRIQMQAFGFSLGATALLTFGYGFLEGVGMPHVSWTFVLPIMAILWGVGTAIFALRYR